MSAPFSFVVSVLLGVATTAGAAVTVKFWADREATKKEKKFIETAPTYTIEQLHQQIDAIQARDEPVTDTPIKAKMNVVVADKQALTLFPRFTIKESQKTKGVAYSIDVAASFFDFIRIPAWSYKESLAAIQVQDPSGNKTLSITDKKANYGGLMKKGLPILWSKMLPEFFTPERFTLKLYEKAPEITETDRLERKLFVVDNVNKSKQIKLGLAIKELFEAVSPGKYYIEESIVPVGASAFIAGYVRFNPFKHMIEMYSTVSCSNKTEGEVLADLARKIKDLGNNTMVAGAVTGVLAFTAIIFLVKAVRSISNSNRDNRRN